MSDRSIAQYYEILRRDLSAFTMRSFLELNPGTKFLWPPYLELLSDRLEKIRRGKIKRLIINMPPRSLKSHCVSIVFPAWLLGHDPAAQIIAVSYGQELSDKFARNNRSLMTSPFYEALFPTRLSPQKMATAEFETTVGGCRLSTSVGGVLTGRGADIIVIDDPLKTEEAGSDLARDGVNEWYTSTLYSRLNDKVKGAIVVVMQRLHEDDLVGYLLRQEGWEVLSLAAIAERDEHLEATTAYGTYQHRRKAGEALHPEREPLEELERTRQRLGLYNFAGQYQQSPAPLGGGMIKPEWFKRYDHLPEKFVRIIQSWDTASVPSEPNSFSACITFGEEGKQLYILDVFRKRLNYPELKRAVRDQARVHGANIVLIENRASGIQLIQELAAEGVLGITKYELDGNKIMRMHAQVGFIESGIVHLPRDAHWLADYLHELVTFPRGTVDDQVDSTSQALDWIQQSRRVPGLIEFYRQEAERLRRPPFGRNGSSAPVKFVRMRSPRLMRYIMNIKYVTNDANSPPAWYDTNPDCILERVHPEHVMALQKLSCIVIEEEK
jgi:predicted phage terminase large subunit-like protein